MKHLLCIPDLNADIILTLIQRALVFKHHQAPIPTFHRKSAALLFYEPSTRTITSFTLACHQLKIFTYPLDLNHASEQKGESLLDTLLTLHALGFTIYIIRHHQDYFYEPLLPHLPPTLQLINAGDGQHEHPSQALLDILTIYESFPDLSHLHIAIIGDIYHSRVAHAFQVLCRMFNITLTLIAPPVWQISQANDIRMTDQLQEGLRDADIVMVLRIQKERLTQDQQFCLHTYQKQFCLTPETLRFAKKNAIVLHPGPMNRGIEISNTVADGPQSRILQQVHNGLWMRMAILEYLITSS